MNSLLPTKLCRAAQSITKEVNNQPWCFLESCRSKENTNLFIQNQLSTYPSSYPADSFYQGLLRVSKLERNFMTNKHNSFSMLPEELRQAAYEIKMQVPTPDTLILSSILVALSTVGQEAINVETPYNSIIPVSLFSMVIAQSGERKSHTLDLIFKPIYEFEIELQEEYEKERLTYLEDHDIWLIRRDALKKNLFNVQSKNLPESKALEEEYKAHLQYVTKKPKLHRLLFSNATAGALLEDMNT